MESRGGMGHLDAARDSASWVWGLRFRHGEVAVDGTKMRVLRASQPWLRERVDYQMRLWREYRTQH